MGVMMTWKVMKQLLKGESLPDDMVISWNSNNREEIEYAKKIFLKYLADGWLAYSDESEGRMHIFDFDDSYDRIILIPPLGGG